MTGPSCETQLVYLSIKRHEVKVIMNLNIHRSITGQKAEEVKGYYTSSLKMRDFIPTNPLIGVRSLLLLMRWLNIPSLFWEGF
jgi:hypothetical protein